MLPERLMRPILLLAIAGCIAGWGGVAEASLDAVAVDDGLSVIARPGVENAAPDGRVDVCVATAVEFGGAAGSPRRGAVSALLGWVDANRAQLRTVLEADESAVLVVLGAVVGLCANVAPARLATLASGLSGTARPRDARPIEPGRFEALLGELTAAEARVRGGQTLGVLSELARLGKAEHPTTLRGVLADCAASETGVPGVPSPFAHGAVVSIAGTADTAALGRLLLGRHVTGAPRRAAKPAEPRSTPFEPSEQTSPRFAHLASQGEVDWALGWSPMGLTHTSLAGLRMALAVLVRHLDAWAPRNAPGLRVSAFDDQQWADVVLGLRVHNVGGANLASVERAIWERLDAMARQGPATQEMAQVVTNAETICGEESATLRAAFVLAAEHLGRPTCRSSVERLSTVTLEPRTLAALVAAHLTRARSSVVVGSFAQPSPKGPVAVVADVRSSASPAVRLPAPSREHVVKPNESLRSIAARYGTTIRQLIEMNRMQHPDRLRVGDRLRVPLAVESAPRRKR